MESSCCCRPVIRRSRCTLRRGRTGVVGTADAATGASERSNDALGAEAAECTGVGAGTGGAERSSEGKSSEAGAGGAGADGGGAGGAGADGAGADGAGADGAGADGAGADGAGGAVGCG